MTVMKLLPANIQQITKEQIHCIAAQFRGDMPLPEVFESEVERWKLSVIQSDVETISAAMELCDQDIYPNIFMLFMISATWPVTTCECERSFSALRRLNTYLRANQTSERIDALAMMHVHRTFQISIDDIIDHFAQLYPRRMELNSLI